MSDGEQFIDYYKILDVDPNCSERTLESSYHFLAKMWHPDHAKTADVARFTQVVEAYNALRNPEDRAAYDVIFARSTGFAFTSGEEENAGETTALSDAEMHARFLDFLYLKRRSSAQDAGVGRFLIQEKLNCSDEHFEFHSWYLKEKGFIKTTENGTLAITIEGVDHVISTSKAIMRERLQIGQSDRRE